MTREELITKLTPLAQEVFQQPALILTDDLCAANLATWTSLSFMQFLTAIETEFGFKFKMMELIKLRTMGAIIDITLTHVA